MVINATSHSSTIKSRLHHIRSVCLLGAGMFLIPTILFPKHSNAFSISSTIISHSARALSQIVLDLNSYSFHHHHLPPSCRSLGSICPLRILTPCWTGWTLCLPAPFQMQPPDVIHPDIQTSRQTRLTTSRIHSRLHG
jgi:hypothetical protein